MKLKIIKNKMDTLNKILNAGFTIEELKQAHLEYRKEKKRLYQNSYNKAWRIKRHPLKVKPVPQNPNNKICNHCHIEKERNCFTKNTSACKVCRSRFFQEKNETTNLLKNQ